MASENNQKPNPNGGFETVSGLTPDRKRLPYKISTADVDKFLSKKLTGLQKKIEGEGCDLIDVSVYSTESSRSYVPFIVVLSMNAIEEKEEKKHSHADSFFTTDRGNGGHKIKLKKFVFEYFKNYTYDKADADAFTNSESFRRNLNLSRQVAANLKGMTTPKIMKSRNGNVIGVAFIIDPIRVFYDMLRFKNDNRQFNVVVEGINKQDASNFMYTVVRQTNNNKKKGYGNNIIDEINFRMRSGK